MSLDLTNLEISSDEIKDEMYSLMENLFPICRSITGNGVRETLKILQNIHEEIDTAIPIRAPLLPLLSYVHSIFDNKIGQWVSRIRILET